MEHKANSHVRVYYLADVFEVFDVVPLCAHDLIDDISSHLVPVLERRAQT